MLYGTWSEDEVRMMVDAHAAGRPARMELHAMFPCRLPKAVDGKAQSLGLRNPVKRQKPRRPVTHPAPQITHDELMELLFYDPATGAFFWLVDRPPGPVRAGMRAGHTQTKGHRTIGIDGHKHPEHRLAWFYMTGEWPSLQIDHKDTIKSNNKWSNLRLATNMQNSHNCGIQKNNTSGHNGVCWRPRAGKWFAYITVNGKPISLGLFATALGASKAHNEARKKYFGEFARVA